MRSLRASSASIRARGVAQAVPTKTRFPYLMPETASWGETSLRPNLLSRSSIISLVLVVVMPVIPSGSFE